MRAIVAVLVILLLVGCEVGMARMNQNETMAIRTIRSIHQAQAQHRWTTGSSNSDGYNFNIRITPFGYEVTANPESIDHYPPTLGTGSGYPG